MIIDGEKWACEACVRGHRVSNCQHADRPLQHINKKGRPVSQCPHCRGLRKSRAAHVRCDCGDKPHAPARPSPVPRTDVASNGGMACPCPHGGQCACALTKEAALGTVPEMASAGRMSAASPRPRPRPRLSTARSEASLIVFGHGQARPAHKRAHSVQKRGAPYRIPPRHHSAVHPDLIRRAMASPTPDPGDLSSLASPVHDAFGAGLHDVRLVHSEHGSPHLSSVSPELGHSHGHSHHHHHHHGHGHGHGHVRAPLPPLDLSFANMSPSGPSRASYDMHGWTPNSVDPYFCATPDSDQPLYSAGLEPPDWAAYDLPLHGAPSWAAAATPPPSDARSPYGGAFDFSPVVHAGYASSVSASDHDDFAGFAIPSPLHPPSLVFNHYGSDASDTCDSESYRLSSASSLHGVPQISLLASNQLDGMSSEEFLAAPVAAPAASSSSYGPAGADGGDDAPGASASAGTTGTGTGTTGTATTAAAATATAAFVPTSFPHSEAPKLSPTSSGPTSAPTSAPMAVPPLLHKRYSLPQAASPPLHKRYSLPHHHSTAEAAIAAASWPSSPLEGPPVRHNSSPVGFGLDEHNGTALWV
ncbi:MAG: hypothetical protein M1826_003755 [Phylliscum demangeonii]|nr:MAG: hypothetical protein M1826_003755 [Phylliscum demangeonii]